MAGFSRSQSVSLHRGLLQLGASTNPNKSSLPYDTLSNGVHSGLDQTIPGFNLDRLFPTRIISGFKAAQARLYPGILWPGPIYTPEYIMA